MSTTEVNIAHKNAERIFARAFTLLGGAFWFGAAFAGAYFYGGLDAKQAMLSQAIYPLVFTAGVLLIGWFYERLTALILILASVGTIAWGLIWGNWEMSVWIIMLVFFVSPSIIAAVLFYMAGNVDTSETSNAEAGASA